MDHKTPCIVIVPSPGISHLIPLVEFAKRFVSLHHEFYVTFIVPTLGPPSNTMKSILEAVPPTIDSIFLPQVNLEDLPPHIPAAVQIQLTVTHSLSSLRNVLKSLISTSNLVALVADLFASIAHDVANEFYISPFIFFPSAMGLSFCLYFPKMDETLTCDFGELQEPVKIPGCIPIHGSDLPNPVQDRSSEAYKSFLRLSKRLRLADGIVVNSFMDMEPGVIKALQEEDGGTRNPPVYPVGPIIQNGSSSMVDGSESLKWLDNQPPKSVVYVSFGSGGTLSFDQVNEIALGLELSGQRFLWAVRAPDNKSANAGYLSVQNEDPLNFLPLGFLERTKGKGQGLVVPNWAPQVEVLSHNSTGGFLTHCGWNSTLESVMHGVPLIAWPLFAEQKMNAVMLCDGLKVALRPKVNEKGLVEKEEVGKVVKDLLESEEGERIRNRMKDIKDAATNALSENGSSTKALSELALRWKNMKLA